MTSIQKLAHNLHTALMILSVDESEERVSSIWAWFGGERVYQYSILTGEEIDSFYNGNWSNKKPTALEVRRYTREHITDLENEMILDNDEIPVKTNFENMASF